MAALGCSSGDNVLEVPKGGPANQPTAEEIEKVGPPQNAKARRGITSRREHEKELEHPGLK
jgi:hypothetical protein